MRRPLFSCILAESLLKKRGSWLSGMVFVVEVGMAEEKNSIRLDKWLWAARFFKTRSLAAKAANGGKVHINGQRAKAAKTVDVGDVLTITIGTMEFVVTVEALSARRGPATIARQLYEESEESREKRESQRALRRMATAGHSSPARRPDKRERRKILEFIRKNSMES